MTKVLILTTSWGHFSIAKAVKDVIEERFETEILFIKPNAKAARISNFMYRYIPNVWGFLYKNTEDKFSQKIASTFSRLNYLNKIRSKISKFKPDIVINTYWAFNSCLDILNNDKRFKFINVIHDPRTFNKILLSEGATNLAFDQKSWEEATTLIPKISGFPVGWFVENKYYEIQKKTRKSVRQELGLDPNKFTLCVVSGSEGMFNVFKIIKVFLKSAYRFQVIITCGKNNSMYKISQKISSLSKSINGPEIMSVPFTKKLHKYMRASDLVIGKAGPNTLFGCVATQTPFFAISHLPGQEDGNLGLIRDYHIGYAEENPTKAIKMLKVIFGNPKKLNSFTKNIKSLSSYCRHSGDRLIKLIGKN